MRHSIQKSMTTFSMQVGAAGGLSRLRQIPVAGWVKLAVLVMSFVCVGVTASAQPVIESIAAAGPGQPAIAQRGWAVIEGQSLVGATVEVSVNGVPALSALDGNDIVFQVPVDTPIGGASFVVTVDGIPTNPFNFPVAAYAPVVGTESEDFRQDGSVAGVVSPGEVISSTAITGLGPDPNPQVTLTIGGLPATVTDLQDAGDPFNLPGIYTITYVVPPALAPGQYTGSITVGGVTWTSTETITIGQAVSCGLITGVAAAWPGEGNASDTVRNSDGVALNGVSYSPGFIGSAFDLDGANDTVTIASSPALKRQALTLDAWVHPRSDGDTFDVLGPVIASKDLAGSGVSYGLFGPGSTNHFTAIVDTVAGVRARAESANAFAFGGTYHVTLTWDGSTLRLYVDGTLEGEQDIGPQQIAYDETPLGLGRHPYFATRHFDGLIDEVTLYDRALSPSEIQTIPNSNTACYRVPNDLYVSDSGSGSIIRFDSELGGFLGTFGTTGRRPFGMTCATNGNLLVATQEGNSLVELDNTTGASRGAFATGLALPTAAITGPNGNVFVAEFNANRVVELDGRSGAFLRIVASGISGPHALAFGPNGNLFVSQNDPNVGVVKVDPATASVVNTFPIEGRPRGLLFNPQGRLYITLLSNTVVELDVGTGQTSVLSGGLAGPHGIGLNPAGDLFVANYSASQIARYNPTGGTFEPFATDGLSLPLGLIVGTSSGPCSMSPPTADPGSPYNGVEGDRISLDGGASNEPEGSPLEYAWDLDNDGVPDQTGSPATLHVFTEGQQTVEFTVTDMSGLSDTASTTVTVLDAPPTVDAGPDQTVPEGQTVFVSASLFDPGIYDQHDARIDWGDGSPAQTVPPIDPQGLPNGAIHAGHSYSTPGLYEVTVSGTDINNGAGDADTLIVSYGLANNPFGQEDSPIFSNLPSTSVRFGFSVDIAGDIAVMGAVGDDDAETDQGAAYVFQRNGTNWDLVQRLLVPEPAATDQFGWSAAIGGSTIVVSARLREVPAPARCSPMTCSTAAAQRRFGWTASTSTAG